MRKPVRTTFGDDAARDLALLVPDLAPTEVHDGDDDECAENHHLFELDAFVGIEGAGEIEFVDAKPDEQNNAEDENAVLNRNAVPHDFFFKCPIHGLSKQLKNEIHWKEK